MKASLPPAGHHFTKLRRYPGGSPANSSVVTLLCPTSSTFGSAPLRPPFESIRVGNSSSGEKRSPPSLSSGNASSAMEGMPPGVSCRSCVPVGSTLSVGVIGASIRCEIAASGTEYALAIVFTAGWVECPRPGSRLLATSSTTR